MRSIADKYSMTPGVGVVVYDPVTLTAVSLGATAIGGGIGAAGTIAGGNYAKSAGEMQQNAKNFEAQQLNQNAADEIASSQRQMFDTQDKTRLAMATSRARAGASGVDAGVGSPATNEGDIAQRGSYHALMDLWQGQSNATGLRNRAAGATYSGELDAIGGEEKQDASYLAAAGTLAGTAGSMFKTYNPPKPSTGGGL